MTSLRLLFFLLLIANVAYFYWAGSVHEPSVALGHPEPSNQALPVQNHNSLKNLVLLSEREPGPAIQPQPVEQAVAEDLCWYIDNEAIGISRQQRDASLVMLGSRLAALDINARLVSVVVERENTFLLYLPPFPSRELALDKLKELLAQGYDAFLLESGEFRNGISLGFFIDRPQAEQEQAAYQARGMDVRIKPYLDRAEEKRVQLSTDENRKISDPLWANLRAGTPGLTRQKNYCHNIVAPK